MSDKNLSEQDWKKFAKGRGLKDAAFFKALAALDAGKTPEARLAALDEIDKQADALRKANKADKELGSYLDDSEKAAGKERKLQEAEAKKAAKQSSSEEDEDDSPAALTGKMIPLLRQVRKGEVMHTMVAVTGKEVAVLVSKKPIGPPKRKVLTDYLGVSGGVKFAVGECIWEENAHTFVLSTQAGGLAKKIKAALLKQVEQRFKVRVRGEDPNDIDDDGEPAEVQLEQAAGKAAAQSAASETPPQAPTVPPAAPAADPSATTFNARLAALLPSVKEAVAANAALGAELKAKIGEAGVLVRSKDFAQANQVLDQVEQKLQALAAAAAARPAAPGVDPAAAFKARLAALMPAVKTALAAGDAARAAALKGLVLSAGELARKRDYAGGQAALDGLKAQLAEQDGGAGRAGAGSISEALDLWREAKETADQHIEALRQALRKGGNPQLIRIAEEGITGGGLNALTGGRMVALWTALMDVQATPADPAARARVRQAAAALSSFLASDHRIELCQSNPFTGPIPLREPLVAALGHVDQMMA